MLKSILFLLVLITFITTPTRAYEAYNISNFIFFEKEQKLLDLEQKRQPEVYELCRVAVEKAEEDYHIKPNLLQTIASVESGRWEATLGRRVAWPWTVHANGRGYYYKTKAEAVAAVQAMQQKGMTNVDVGCMQINLKYHGAAFSSLEEAFEPEKNVAYSARFLQKLYLRNRQDWKMSAMHYHSKNWRKGVNYKNRLEKHYAEYVREDGVTTSLF